MTTAKQDYGTRTPWHGPGPAPVWELPAQPAKTALAWLLASDETPETKIREAIKALREYGFDESKPLAKGAA